MLNKLLAGLALCVGLAFGQNPNTAVYPGGVATDSDLLIAANRCGTTLTTAINAVTLTIPVASSTCFIVPTMITVGDEYIKITSKSAGQLNASTRGFDSSTAAIHSSGAGVSANATRYYFNQLAAEIKAIEGNAVLNVMTTLGDTTYGGASGAVTRLAGNITATKKFFTQTGNGSVSAAPGWNTIVAGDVPTLNQNTSGNAATATALASNPTETGCTAITAVTAIDTGANLTCTAITLAAADGTTLGLAAFAAADFNTTLGVVSLDYTNGQAASGSLKGFLTSADWTTFNAKQAAGNYITALTSDVTASGPGSAAATIAARAVSYAKIQAMATAKVLGRTTAGSGDIEELGTLPSAVQDNITRLGTISSGTVPYANVSGTPTLYNQTIQEEGSDLTQRAKLNFVGSMTCADANPVTTCTTKNRQITLVVTAPTSTGTKACSVAEVSGTIVAAHLIADALPTGANLVVDVKKVAFSSYTGIASASSITASAVPTIATGDMNPRYSDTTLTGWTTSITADDVICVAINTAPSGGSTWASLTLEIL